MYLYLATSAENTRFKNRGKIRPESGDDPQSFANHMARHGLEVWVGEDIGNAVDRATLEAASLQLLQPTKDLRPVRIVAPPPQFTPATVTAGAVTVSRWRRFIDFLRR